MERCGGGGGGNGFPSTTDSNNGSNANVPALILLAAANPCKMQCVQ